MSVECKCQGKIENCLYCHGTGIIEDKDTLDKIDQILSETRVVHCPSCGRQNRIMDKLIEQGGEPVCHVCGSPLFIKSENIFDLISSKRKKEKGK